MNELQKNLKEIIESSWDKSSFIKLSLSPKAKEIEEATQFLDSYYSKIPLRTRAYAIKHDITEQTIPKCKCGCNQPAAINLTYTDQGFRDYATPECSRKSKTVPKNVKEKLESYEWLYEQRITQKKSIEAIAKDLGVSTIPVAKYLKLHKLHEIFDCRKINEHKLLILENYDLMYDYYITQNLTLRDIAKIVNCSTNIVVKHLNLHNIPIKNPNFYERKTCRNSKQENDLFQFIQSIEDTEIIQGNRNILNGREIDIFIPRKNIAFEYNGIYSHLYRKNETTSSKIKDKDYHLSKTLLANNKGINLYHFYSSEWIYENDRFKDFIKRKLHLNQILDTNTNYEIVEKLNEAQDLILSFIVDNSIVAKMKLNNSKNHVFIKEYQVKYGITLKNGFIKLLNYLKETYKKPIYCKIDRRFGEGRLYTSYGFRIIKIIKPKFLYTDNSYDRLYENKIPNKKNYETYNCGYLLLKCS